MEPRNAAPADFRDILASAAFLQGFDDAALDDLARTVEWLVLPGGQTLFRRGDAADSLYIVASGRLRVVLEPESGQVEVLAEVSRGGHVGELALLTGEPHTTTVVAVRDTELARLGREQFDRLLETHPRAILGLVRTVAAWLQRSRRPVSSRPATLAMLPLLLDTPCTDLTHALERALAPRGPTLRLGLAELEQRLGPGAGEVPEHDPRYASITRWLNEQELHHAFVVYDASAGSGPWTRRCLRQADRVLAVARAGQVRRQRQTLAGAHQPLLGSERGRLELVMLHPAGTALSQDTATALALHPFVAHHHVRDDVPADIERLARLVTGDAVGLVLSGGGARAFAHIGVAKALEEAGILIDRVGGASVGAVIAAQLARGHSAASLSEINRGRWKMDYTIPRVALLAGRQAARSAREWFGDGQIEDLWIPYFGVSTSLTSSRLVIHRDGPVAEAVRASIAIPGILPPVRSNGQLLVDGALLNNLPVDVMRSMGGGPIIAVDCSPPIETYLNAPAGRASTADWLLSLVSGGQDASMPNILRILQRSALVPSAELAQRLRGEADVCATPPVAGFDFFDFRSIDRIVEAGYRYAAERVPEWKERLFREA